MSDDLEILSTLHEPFLVLDPASSVVAVNEAFCTHFRLTREELLGRRLHEVAGGEWDIPSLRALIRDAASHEEIRGYEIRHYFERLGPRTLRINLRPVRGEQNRIRHLFLAFDDVTERSRRSSSAPPDAARLFATHASDLLALHDARGRWRYVSPSCRALLGHSEEEVRRIHPLRLLHHDDRERVRETLERIVLDGRPARFSYRVRRPGGEVAWMESVATRTRSAEGPVLIQTITRDVTQRKRTEEALEWLGRQTQLILNNAAEGIFGLDASGKVTFVNASGARMLAYVPPELLGQPFHPLCHHSREDGTGLPAEACPIHDTLRVVSTHRVIDEVFWRRDGSCFRVEYTSTPAIEAGKVVGAVVTFRDVTELRRAEWLAGIGETTLALRHEINNPLTSVLADVSLLEMGGNTQEEEREMIASMAKQVRRIRDVVQRLWERQGAPSVRYVGNDRMLDLTDGEAD